MESNGETAQPFLSYQASVHGRAVANGSQKAAVCTDCHGVHQILPASDPKSPISKFAVASTCGKCHTDVANTFTASIHGQALARGNLLAPTCTDCHGIHSIKRHTDPNSPVAEQNVSRDICARCHEGVRLSQEFGVPGEPRHQLLRQLSRSGRRGRFGRRRQLLQLPRRARHSAFQRSPLHHQSRQPRRHLRPMPQRRDAKVHAHARASSGRLALRRYRLRRRPLGAMDLHSPHPSRHRRHVPAQRHHLALESRRPPPHAEPLHDAHDGQSALAAPRPALELHHSRHHRLRAQVPRHLVRPYAGHGREPARHHPSRRGCHSHRRRHLSRLLSRHRARRPAPAARHRAPPQRRIRCVGHDALLPRPQRARSQNSAASATPKKPSTGRSSGARPSWASPAS